MSNEMRGSEKLMQNCSAVTPLSSEELEIVSGGYEFQWKPFPRGVPPLFHIDDLVTLDHRVISGQTLAF